jgi:probable HAF family extracellular repeat protein
MTKTKITILTSLLLSSTLSAAAMAGPPQQQPGNRPTLPHYLIKDVGSLGGGFGLYSNPASRVLNSRGVNAGMMTTDIPDPFCPDWCFDSGNADHAFVWKHGHATDLGSLSDGASSFPFGINDKGLVVGLSETGGVDPVTGAPVAHAVRWQGGGIQDIGALGGAQSLAAAVNRQGKIAVPSETGISDPYVNVAQANCLWLPSGIGTACNQFDFGTNLFLLPVTSQTHAGIVSPHQELKDLGTLGGPDSAVYDINDAGQATGWSYASYDAGVSGVPDTRPVLWDKGSVTDMGSLGGTFGAAMLINKNGQAIGISNLPGDMVVHPFVWDKDNGMTDLGSFGGWYAHPNWINDNGDVVGISSYPDNTRRAFYWHDGGLHDLGTIGTDDRSVAVGINNNRLIVGYTFTNGGEELRGFISDQGGALVDVNTLIAKPHGLSVLAAYYINDRNEIVGFALTKSGEIHPVVLIPENDPNQPAQTDGTDASIPQSAQGSHRVMGGKRIAICGKGRTRARICASQ